MGVLVGDVVGMELGELFGLADGRVVGELVGAHVPIVPELTPVIEATHAA